jgi:branched-chain amino acid transport system permease protein
VLNLAVAGLAAGGVYALIGVCLVLSYRVGAVINFSQTFVATLAVFSMTEFLDKGLNQWLGILAALLIAGALAGFQGWIMAKVFTEATIVVRSAVTIGMAITFLAITVAIFHDTLRNFPVLFSSIHPRIGDVTVTGAVLGSVVLACGISLVLWLGLTQTRLGVIMRAVSARPTTAELMGVKTMPLIVFVWALAGMLTCMAMLLVAPTRGNISALSLLVIPGLAAAVFGAMRSFGLTVIGGLLIGSLESVAQNWGTIGQFRPTLSFIMVTAVLLWSQRKETWGEAR